MSYTAVKCIFFDSSLFQTIIWTNLLRNPSASASAVPLSLSLIEPVHPKFHRGRTSVFVLPYLDEFITQCLCFLLLRQVWTYFIGIHVSVFLEATECMTWGILRERHYLRSKARATIPFILNIYTYLQLLLSLNSQHVFIYTTLMN
jgi:hypothetical protein